MIALVGSELLKLRTLRSTAWAARWRCWPSPC